MSLAIARLGRCRTGSSRGHRTIVFLECERTVRTGEHQHLQGLRIAQIIHLIALAKLLQRHDTASLGKHRHTVDRTPHFQTTPGLSCRNVTATIEEVIPFTLRQPCFRATQLRGIVIVRNNWCNQQLSAETEFIRHLVRLRIVRIRPIHRLHQWHALERGAIVHGVQVRQHHMAQSQRTHHGIAHFRGEVPRLLAHELRIAGMQAIDRAERAKLVPTGFQMLVTIATHT